MGSIAEKYETSRQTVALSWALQSGAIILPRSSNPDNIRENVQGFVRFEPGCEDLLNGGVDPSTSYSSSSSSSSSSSGEGGDEASGTAISVAVGECEEEVHGSGAAGRYGRSRVAVMLTANDMIKIDRLDGAYDIK